MSEGRKYAKEKNNIAMRSVSGNDGIRNHASGASFLH